MKEITKTSLLTTLIGLIGAGVAFFVQKAGNKSLTKCSYLDPITIDILAFLAALFLVVEGIYRIYEHRKESVKNQFTRALRVGFGCAILTIHIMQFIHK